MKQNVGNADNVKFFLKIFKYFYGGKIALLFTL